MGTSSSKASGGHPAAPKSHAKEKKRRLSIDKTVGLAGQSEDTHKSHTQAKAETDACGAPMPKSVPKRRLSISKPHEGVLLPTLLQPHGEMEAAASTTKDEPFSFDRNLTIDKSVACEGDVTIPCGPEAVVSSTYDRPLYLNSNLTLDKIIAGEVDVKIHSKTDKIGLQPFTEKGNVQTHGHGNFMEAAGIACICQKGIKPGTTAPNQDSWCVIQKGPLYAFGLFDGHGEFGHEISNLAAEALAQIVLEGPSESFRADPDRAFRNAFKQMQDQIRENSKNKTPDASQAGTTATVVVWDTFASKLSVAHVGDSGACLVRPRVPEHQKTCCLCFGKQGSTSRCFKLTEDHKPQDTVEKKRIEQKGGSVVFDGYCNHRVFAVGQSYPGLNMSRALGDLLGQDHAGISCEPTISEFTIGDDEDDAILLLCTDGVWEFMETEDVASVICAAPQQNAAAEQIANIAERLVVASRKRWIEEEDGEVVDDITALVVHLSRSAAAVCSSAQPSTTAL